MSHLQYFNHSGVGQTNRNKLKFSQAVRVGDRIECSGQGGCDPLTGKYYKEINTQINQAFANVDFALRTAGGEGWSQVFRVNSYHVPINKEATDAMVRNFHEWAPQHEPLWTPLGVSRLAGDDMRVAIEVVAHDPKTASTA